MKLGWLFVLAACSHPAPPTPAAQPTPPGPLDPRLLADIPGPPDLPEVPVVNECETFDLKNPACRNDPRMCTEGGADCKCPSPPDVKFAPCWAVMPCPAVPDKRVRACRPKFPACPDPDHPDGENPNCPPAAMLGRIIAFDAPNSLITIGVGTNAGLSSRWKATLLRAETDAPLDGGDIEILRVDRTVTVGRVRLPEAVVRANTRVRFGH